MLTATKGTAVLNTIFKGYEPWSGDITTRDLGSLVAHETGAVTGYALESTQARGRMFVAPATRSTTARSWASTSARAT